MKPEIISEAIGMIDDDIIEAADKARAEPPRKKSRAPLWISFGSMAACAAIIASVAITNISDKDSIPTDGMQTEESTLQADDAGVVSPETEEDIIVEDAVVETADGTDDIYDTDDENPGAGGDWLEGTSECVDDALLETAEELVTDEITDKTETGGENGSAVTLEAAETETAEGDVDDVIMETVECLETTELSVITGEAVDETMEWVESCETDEWVVDTSEYELTFETAECIETEDAEFIETGGKTGTISRAEYPDLTKPLESDFATYQEYYNAEKAYEKLYEYTRRNFFYTDAISGEFLGESMKVFLSGNDGKNVAYSPANTYVALAMLAETTGGSTRQEILDALDASGLGALRKMANGMWARCYSDNKNNCISHLANSLWLRSGFSYNLSVLDRICENYYASVHAGQMGDPLYDQSLREWINEQTGGMLKEQAGDITLSPETVMAMVSTVHYNAQWSDEFSKDENTVGTFYKSNGTEIQTEFMNREDYESWLYIGEGFSAVKVNADGYPGDGMWFFLPDEGITPEQLVENNMLYEFFYNGGKDNNATYRIDLSVPKFDITSETDLKSGLEKLGITEIFSKENADFSPLLGEDMPSWVDTAESAVRVSINEQGVSASSYIIVENAGMGVFPEADEIEFTLDRPFIFVVEKVRMPMFCGIVNEP